MSEEFKSGDLFVIFKAESKIDCYLMRKPFGRGGGGLTRIPDSHTLGEFASGTTFENCYYKFYTARASDKERVIDVAEKAGLAVEHGRAFDRDDVMQCYVAIGLPPPGVRDRKVVEFKRK